MKTKFIRALWSRQTNRFLLVKTLTWSIISWVSYIIVFGILLEDTSTGFILGTGVFAIKACMYFIHDYIWYQKILKRKTKVKENVRVKTKHIRKS